MLLMARLVFQSMECEKFDKDLLYLTPVTDKLIFLQPGCCHAVDNTISSRIHVPYSIAHGKKRYSEQYHHPENNVKHDRIEFTVVLG